LSKSIPGIDITAKVSSNFNVKHRNKTLRIVSFFISTIPKYEEDKNFVVIVICGLPEEYFSTIALLVRDVIFVAYEYFITLRTSKLLCIILGIRI